MGIQTYTDLCYGIEYGYDEVQKVRECQEWKKYIEELGEMDFASIWSELGYETACPYYDAREEDMTYFIGSKLTGMSLAEIQALDENELKEEVKKQCEELGLPYVEPGLVLLSTIA